MKKASQSISLIAGNYGDSDTDEDHDTTSPTKKKRHQGVHVKVQKPASKQAKPLLKDIPGIFKNDDEDEDNENPTGDNIGKPDEQPPKKKRRWGKYLVDMYTYKIEIGKINLKSFFDL